MAKRGTKPKTTISKVPFYKKVWVWITAIISPIILLFGALADVSSGWDVLKKSVISVFMETSPKKDSLSLCSFPKKFQKDTLYILVTRFESYISTVETECYGRSLQARIDLIANQRKLPVRVCYNQNIAINTIDEAKRVQMENNADVVFYGTIRNIEKSCMKGDVCFKNQISDTLIRLAGGKVIPNNIDIKYEKDVSPQRIEEGDFHVNEKRFDTWLLNYYNTKIGKFNPDLYAIDESLQPKDKANEYLEKAKFYYNLNKFSEAIKNFNVSIVLNKYNANAYNNRGNARHYLNDYQAAIDDFSEAINLDSKFAYAYYNRGNAKYNLKNYQAAIDDFSKAIELDSTFLYAYYNRGNAKYNLKNYQAAIDDFSKAIETSNYNDAYAYNNRGVIKYNLKDFSGANSDFSKAIEIEPDDAYAYDNRGNVKYDLKDYVGANSDFSKAIEINPNDANIYNARGSIKYDLSDYIGANSDFSKAIEIEPKYIIAYFNRGNLRDDLKDYDGAIQDYSKVIELDSNYAVAYFNRGISKLKSGFNKAAENDFRKAKELGYEQNNKFSLQKIGLITVIFALLIGLFIIYLNPQKYINFLRKVLYNSTKPNL